MPHRGHPMSATEHNQHVELPITGMTCASCANRIERKLNKLDGVSATVNYATEKATVDYDPDLAKADDFLSAVEAAGYQAVLPAAEPAHSQHEQNREIVPALYPAPRSATCVQPQRVPLCRDFVRVSDGTRTRGRRDHNPEPVLLIENAAVCGRAPSACADHVRSDPEAGQRDFPLPPRSRGRNHLRGGEYCGFLSAREDSGS